MPICKLEQQTLCYCVIALQVLRQLGASKSHWVLPYADNFLGFGLGVHFLSERKGLYKKSVLLLLLPDLYG